MAQHAGLTVSLESIKAVPGEKNPPESFQPLSNPLESIVGDPQQQWALGQPGRDLYKLNIEWGAVEGLKVKRTFDQKRVEVKGRPFNTGVQESSLQSLLVSPFRGATLTMDQQRTETFDLAGISLGATEVDSLGFSQEYGQGTTAGKASFTRKVTRSFAGDSPDPLRPLSLTQTTVDQTLNLSQGFSLLGQGANVAFTRSMTSTGRPQEYSTGQTSDTLSFSMPLWADTRFSGTYGRSHSTRPEGLHSQQRSFSLTRALAAGEASVSYDRKTSRAGGIVDETTTQSYKLPLRVDGTTLNLAFSSSSTQRNLRDVATSRSASLTSKLGGNDVAISWSRNVAPKDGAEITTSLGSFSLPISFYGEKIALTYVTEGTQAGEAVQKKQRTTSLVVPLNHYRPGTTLSHTILGLQQAGQPSKEIRTTVLTLPVSLFGRPVATEHQRISTHTPSGQTMQYLTKASGQFPMFGRMVTAQNQYTATNLPGGSEQDQLLTTLSVPFKPGPAVITRQVDTSTTPQGQESRTRTVTVVGPRVPLSAKTSVQADVLVTDLPTGTHQNTTHVNLQTQVSPRIGLAGDYRIVDPGTTASTKDRQLDVSYAIADRLQLNARYLEREQLDRSPFVQRTMVLQRQPANPADLRLRAAVTQTDTGQAEGDLMKIFELGLGDPRAVGLNVRLQQYDEAKLTSLGDPTVQLGLQHGDASSVNWSVVYEDSNGRPLPLRRYSLGFPVADSTLKLSLSQNAVDPTDPKQQRLRLADVYDATLSRRVMGDVNLNVGYRYCDYLEQAASPEAVQQWLQLGLKGGRPERGGAVQLSYATGDFVTLNTDNPAATAQSTLSLRYEKKWIDAGGLALQLDRTDMPDTPAFTDTLEGRLQFDYKF